MSTAEQNKAQTIITARKKIAQLGDANDRGDLIYRFGVASGWVSALRLEGLLDSAAFDTLNGELLDTFSEVGRHLDVEPIDDHEISQLEQSLVERARGYLSGVQDFYTKAKLGTAGEQERRDYERDHAAMNALLKLGPCRDSGMSEVGRNALLAVEVEAAVALRDYCS